MKHRLSISVSRTGTGRSGIFRCRRIRLRDRLFRMLFGETHELTVFIPGNTVEEVSISEIGGGSDD